MAIHKIDADEDCCESWVISSAGTWLPGAYESKQAARYAFQFPNETLVKLRDAAIERGGDRVITMDDLRDERAQQREVNV